MLRSLGELYRIDLGFDIDRVLYGEVLAAFPGSTGRRKRARGSSPSSRTG